GQCKGGGAAREARGSRPWLDPEELACACMRPSRRMAVSSEPASILRDALRSPSGDRNAPQDEVGIFVTIVSAHGPDERSDIRDWELRYRTPDFASLIRAPRRQPSLAARRRHALEGELLHAVVGGCHEDVALGIGGDVVAAANHARSFDRADDRQRLAVEHRDVLAVTDIEELLL